MTSREPFERTRTGRLLLLPLLGWRRAFESLGPNILFVTGMAGVIALGAGLQSLFTYWVIPAEDSWIVPLASILWQAVMATSMAVLVAPIHRWIIGKGAAHPLPNGFAPMKRRRLYLRSGLYGFGIWFVTDWVGVGLRSAVLLTSGRGREIAFYVAMFGSFAFVSRFALVRPALSLGAPAPVKSGLRFAFRRPLSLLVVSGMLQIVPNVIEPILILAPRAPAIFGPSALAQQITIVSTSIFALLQFLAVEASTVIFAQRAAAREAYAQARERLPVSQGAGPATPS